VSDSLDTIFKAYDVRGVYPDEIDEPVAKAIGNAFVQFTDAPTVVVGYDMRPSSVPLSRAFIEGATLAGADVVDVGLASTDLVYFAAGSLDSPAAMFTASHNPAQYNGIKLCRAGAAPVGQDSGLREIRRMIDEGVPAGEGPLGQVREQDMLTEYAQFLRELVDVSEVRRLKVVVDAGNGMGGFTVPAVLGDEAGLPSLPLDIDPLYFELDGTFPNHEANPIDAENMRDLQARVREVGADLGLAFDGDADRCFVVDERGEIVNPSTLTALIAARELAKHPGSTVIHNLITSKAVPEVIVENGGTPVRTRVGHSFIKQTMADTGAVFGGEHSGHFYFRDFWRADSGMLAALHTIAALGETPEGTTLSSMLAPYDRYVASGEINTEVADQAAATETIRQEFAARGVTDIEDFDGMTVTGDTWWFNVRPSNTEPLLRLNVEAADETQMAQLRDDVLALMRQGA